MAEWLYEEGIGESRAVLLEGDDILEAAIELPDTLRVGTVAEARLAKILVPAGRGVVVVDGREAMLEPLSPSLTEGQKLRIEIVREGVAEPGRPKLPKARLSEEEPRPGLSLLERLGAPSVHRAQGPDRFEQAGWSELLEEALTGEISFAGGALRMSLTPAMTLFDVDGALPPAALACAGAAAAARAIRRFGIGGSIGIDLPTLSGKAERQAAAAAFDEWLPQPFERTAVNGFGFLQVVRRRERPSLPEILQGDRVGAAARALLRRAERTPGAGERTIRAAPAIVARIEGEAGWTEALSRRIGAPVRLRADPSLPIFGGDVQSAHS